MICAYPKGTYIGVEPNKETYKGLLKLKDELIIKFPSCTIQIFNCKIEDLNTDDLKYDLAFTSIPYYTLEDYKNDFNYNSFEDWSNTFVKKISSLKNTVINLPLDIQSKLNLPFDSKLSLINNTSHYNLKDKIKEELILIRNN